MHAVAGEGVAVGAQRIASQHQQNILRFFDNRHQTFGIATLGEKRYRRGGRLGAKETSFQINILDAVPIRLRHLQKIDPWKDPSIVDQDADATKIIYGGHHPFDIGWLGHTTGNRYGLATGRYNAPDLLVGGSLIMEIVYHHGSAFAAASHGERHANTLLRACDPGYFILQS